MARTSEIFVVGIPPTPATLNLIGQEIINALPTGALFLLVTRMAVVEQEALWRRTRAGEIRAAVDVFEPEPLPADSPIRSDAHVLPTPHIAGGTLAAHCRCFTTECEDVVAVLQGRPANYAVSVKDATVYAGTQEEKSP